jgi:anti-sigma28 factor (negative regulator of flagellin synthesis)
MKINGSYFDPLKPTPTSTPAVQRPAQEITQSPATRPVKSDSVSISAEGRKLNADQREALDPERVAELRQKVMTGAYNTLDVVDQVARRILVRGDL